MSKAPGAKQLLADVELSHTRKKRYAGLQAGIISLGTDT
jgi:hypothetical protein